MSGSSLRLIESIDKVDPIPVLGRVSKVVGLVMEGYAPISAIGEICRISSTRRNEDLLAEVVGFRDERVLLMPLGETTGVGPGSSIVCMGNQAHINVGPELLGRVIDGLGNPLDDKPPLTSIHPQPLYLSPPNPISRRRISEPLDLGIRSINGLLTCGKGQRIGIFAGSGVGKSVLLGMIARYTNADVNVIALIGERGREVKEFIQKHIKTEALNRSVVVVATSDQPPLVRRRGAFIAMAIAEYFRDQGHHVLFMMDSLTRLAQAQREIGLSIGEPPTTKGYTPSVFSLLPKFLERAGTSQGPGTITGLITVLAEGDDLNDPIPDTSRAILDGHIVLSRELAAQNHYPAIDLLNSTSRTMMDVIDKSHWSNSRQLIDLLSTYKRSEDLIQIGAYKTGSDAKIDKAIRAWDSIQSYLQQEMDEQVNLQSSIETLSGLIQAKNTV